MTLTLSDGPLSGSPPDSNYSLEGPQHKLLFHEFPRRVRGRFEGETVLDTTRGRLLHETGILPVFYAPVEDLERALLEESDHSRTQSGTTPPTDDASWLRGYAAVYWDAMDSWFDEEQEIRGHLRDPYHRVDIRRSSRHVRVTAHGETIAESRQPVVLFETGLGALLPAARRRPPRLLEASDTETVCPYKGTANWWSLSLGDRSIDDAAWSYPEPLDEAREARDHISFFGEGIAVEVDGERVE